MTAVEKLDSTICLTEHQQQAYDQLHAFLCGDTSYAMGVLSGYAGTGKTTLVEQLVSVLAEDNRIVVAAPTHKAVKVLREKLAYEGRVEFSTLHSLLGLRLKERRDGTMECVPEGKPSIHEYDLVIIDECSMIGRDLFATVASGKRRALVLFVGDPAQLPPVGEPGDSPVFSCVDLHVSLSEVVRQARENPIIGLSMAVREAMQQDRVLSPFELNRQLPPMQQGVTACLAAGGPQTVVSWALAEQRAKRDARIIAYTNRQVQTYNRAMHEALYGIDAYRFVPGQRVIAHEQMEARDAEDRPVLVHTSEELDVVSVEAAPHPKYDEISAHRITLERESGGRVYGYVADDPEHLQQLVGGLFAEWRRLNQAKQQLSGGERVDTEVEAKRCSSRAWGLKKAFLPLRHAYAITAHKAQGSTFDTALVDYADLCRMRSPFEMNRALYVAITRPRDFLAVVTA